MPKRKVCIVNGNKQFDTMFNKRGWDVVKNPEDAEFIQFCGGADVSPYVYKEPPHERCMQSEIMRDIHEWKLFVNSPDKVKLGVCRGGQFLWVMNKGTLFQDVDNHGRHHDIIDVDTGDRLLVTSTHHQMFRHSEDTLKSAKIVAIANESNVRRAMNQDRSEYIEHGQQDDIEVAVFNKTRSLCFQPHPEFCKDQTQEYYFDCIEKYMVPLIYQG